MIFILAVAEVITGAGPRSPSILQIFVALWTDLTFTFLALLLYTASRREPSESLSRPAAQIFVLSGLGFSWIVFILAMLTQTLRACAGDLVACSLFTTIHLLSWFLMITLFSAAYATYRMAADDSHGASMVLPTAGPHFVEAWRLSNNADSEGAIKI
ncbi:hypothetical protein FB451DRAFT_1564795 [Mycena latifolia]|nr:hypothetical protein FB451DRAFT_1564795 [Mycena latifolia]